MCDGQVTVIYDKDAMIHYFSNSRGDADIIPFKDIVYVEDNKAPYVKLKGFSGNLRKL